MCWWERSRFPRKEFFDAGIKNKYIFCSIKFPLMQPRNTKWITFKKRKKLRHKSELSA